MRLSGMLMMVICLLKTLGYFLFCRFGPNSGCGLLTHKVFRSHTTTHHSRQDSSGRVISLSQRPLPDNTQHSKQTDIHARARDSNPQSQQASGHWDRLHQDTIILKSQGILVASKDVGPEVHAACGEYHIRASSLERRAKAECNGS